MKQKKKIVWLEEEVLTELKKQSKEAGFKTMSQYIKALMQPEPYNETTEKAQNESSPILPS